MSDIRSLIAEEGKVSALMEVMRKKVVIRYLVRRNIASTSYLHIAELCAIQREQLVWIQCSFTICDPVRGIGRDSNYIEQSGGSPEFVPAARIFPFLATRMRTWRAESWNPWMENAPFVGIVEFDIGVVREYPDSNPHFSLLNGYVLAALSKTTDKLYKKNPGLEGSRGVPDLFSKAIDKRFQAFFAHSQMAKMVDTFGT